MAIGMSRETVTTTPGRAERSNAPPTPPPAGPGPDGLRNLRMLGGQTGRAGQRVRPGLLYRSDELARATDDDRAGLARLGLRTVIDLRTSGEVSAGPVPPIRGFPAHHHLPMVPPAPFETDRGSGLVRGLRPSVDPTGPLDPVPLLVESYLDLLVVGAPSVADALRILSAPGAHPALVHSVHGRDRAGLVVAVLLGVLGVHDEEIAADYACGPSTSSGGSGTCGAGIDQPDPEVVLAVLAHLRASCGSVVGYVRRIGVEVEVLEALHARLLD